MGEGAKVKDPANTGSRRGCRANERGGLSYSPSSRMNGWNVVVVAREPSRLAAPISAPGVASSWRYFRSLEKSDRFLC